MSRHVKSFYFLPFLPKLIEKCSIDPELVSYTWQEFVYNYKADIDRNLDQYKIDSHILSLLIYLNIDDLDIAYAFIKDVEYAKQYHVERSIWHELWKEHRPPSVQGQ